MLHDIRGLLDHSAGAVQVAGVEGVADGGEVVLVGAGVVGGPERGSEDDVLELCPVRDLRVCVLVRCLMADV